MNTSDAGARDSTASRISRALRTSMRSTPGGVASADRPCDQRHVRALRRRSGGDRETHAAGAAVADEAHRIDVLEGRARADQHAHAGKRARRARRDELGDDVLGFEQAPRAEFAAGLAAGRGTEHAHAALAQRREIRLRRRVRPHLLVHRRRERDRRGRRKTDRRQKIVRHAMREPRDEVGRRRRDDDLRRPSARARCDPSPLRPTRPRGSIAPDCPDSAWNVSAVTKRAAPSVSTTRTSAPASRRRRTSSAALYAAMPPDTPSSTR